MDTIKQAEEIALRDLRDCYHEQGILASKVNFSDYWARDTFWACIGLLEAQIDLEKVKNCLELFLNYQHPGGKIPRKICLDYNSLKYVGLKIKRRKPRPIYTSAIKMFTSVDDNLLFVIAFCLYIQKTNDYEFGKKYLEKVAKALNFYQDKNLIIDSLIFETGLGNWMDTIFKRGFVLYSNTLWYKAVKEFENITGIYSLKDTAAKAPATSEDILKNIQSKFWAQEKGYFADNVSFHGQQVPYFDLAGNVQAILFDVASKEQSQRILSFVQYIETKQKSGSLLHAINYPLYPWWKISPATYFFGIQAYQNGINWSWIEALLTAAMAKAGHIEKATLTLENFSKIIVKNGHVHENYHLDGTPFDHLLWKSAVPFAWGSGLFLYGYKILEESITNNKQ